MSPHTNLLSAVMQGGVEDLVAAIAGGHDLDVRDSAGWTPLMWAAGAGDLEKLQLLLQSGADPFAQDADGRTAYLVAAAAGRSAAAQLISQFERNAGGDGLINSSLRHASRPYCRAYPARALRRFSGWRENILEGRTQDGGSPPIEDDDLLFLHRDLRVTRSVFEGDPPVFDGDAVGWAAFCRDQLGFAPVTDDDWIAALRRFN